MARAVSQLLIEDLKGLSADELTIFNKYLTLRNKAIAHAEYNHHPTEFDPEFGATTMTRFTIIRYELKLDELEQLVVRFMELCRNKRIDYATSKRQKTS